MKTKSFTLIELLMIVAIIGILVSILIPSISKARELGKQAVCGSNYKQIYVGAMLDTQNNNYYLPLAGGGPRKGWVQAISIALDLEYKKSDIFVCPTVPVNNGNNSSYTYSKWCGLTTRSSPEYAPVLINNVSKPSAAWYICENSSNHYNGAFWGNRTGKEHLGKSQGILLDGSIININKPNQNKLNPDWPGYWAQWAFFKGQ